MDRDEIILSWRTHIQIDNTRISLDEEAFQNNTLRPILKFQNEIILAIVSIEINDRTIPSLQQEKLDFIKIILQNNTIKQRLLGMIVALFTKEEFSFYKLHDTAINKRISQLLVKRLADQL
ncbi:MAG: hypothetical protein V4538_13100 [Bacteroidota bacterium]